MALALRLLYIRRTHLECEFENGLSAKFFSQTLGADYQ
jgi:hypothetical protein